MAVYYFLIDESDVPFTYLTPTLYVGALPPPYAAVEEPDIFLRFASEDIKSGDTGSLVNAFSNVKKALHLRIDMLLHQYGLLQHYRRRNLPTKLALLDEVGLLPTTMISNLNAERNMVEHEYVVPTLERVNEAVDVTQLLYLASKGLLEKSISEGVVGIEDSPAHAILRLEPNLGELRLFEIEPKPNTEEWENGIEVVSDYPRGPRTKFRQEYAAVDVPFEVFVLDERHKDQWLPIIKLLASLYLSSKDWVKSGKLQQREEDEVLLASTTVTFPFSLMETTGVTEAATDALNKSMEREDETETTGERSQLGQECANE